MFLEPTGIFPVDARIDGVDDSDDTYGKHKDEMGDEEKDNYEEKMAKAASAYSSTFPSSGKIYAYVKMGYDRSLKAHLESQGTNFKTWIDSVMTHVQTHYKHKSLPVRILFKVTIYQSRIHFKVSK